MCEQAMHAIGLPGRQVLRAGNLLAGRLIGEFKCDVGTVYAAPGELVSVEQLGCRHTCAGRTSRYVS